MVLCDRCVTEPIRDVLTDRGIHTQEMLYTYKPGGQNRRSTTLHEVLFVLPYDLDLEVTFGHESGITRLLKRLSSELQTGDKVFDDAILIRTEQRDRVALLLERAAIREAILECTAELGGPHSGLLLQLEGNRCRVNTQLGHSSGVDEPRVERSLAVLFAHLRTWALSLGLSPRPELLGLPDLTSLHDHMGELGLEQATLSHTVLASLEAFRTLWTSQEVDQIHGLAFHDCRILSGDLSPLVVLDWLRTLSFKNVAEVVDIGPLAGLSSLRSLTLYGTGVRDLSAAAAMESLETLLCQHTPVRDLSPLRRARKLRGLAINGTEVVELGPIADLRYLEELNLGGLVIDDLAPLFGLQRLRKLWLRGARVDASQLEDLRGRHPGLVIKR